MAIDKQSNKNQAEIPGTERPDAIEEIDNAGRSWRDAQIEFNQAKEKLELAKNECHAAMKRNDLDKYVLVDGDWTRVLTYETVGQIKMRKPKKDEADEEHGHRGQDGGRAAKVAPSFARRVPAADRRQARLHSRLQPRGQRVPPLLALS